MIFSGIIQTAMPEQSGVTAAGKAWRRKDFILLYDNTNAQYPKTVLFSVMGDNIDKLTIQQGVEYEVEIDFTTREYNGRPICRLLPGKQLLRISPHFSSLRNRRRNLNKQMIFHSDNISSTMC